MIMTMFAKLIANLRLVAEAVAEGIEMNRAYSRQHPGADS
jgi:hypothetical protein